MNKLISLSSEGKFSIIDSVIEKVSAGQFSKKVDQSKSAAQSMKSSSSSMQTSEEFEKVFASHKDGSTSKFEVITEEVDEDEALEVLIKEEIAASNLDEVNARR